jgi:hypothetical protein
MANLGRDEFFPNFLRYWQGGCPSPLLGLIETQRRPKCLTRERKTGREPSVFSAAS